MQVPGDLIHSLARLGALPRPRKARGSRYMPHQGQRECARRRARLAAGKAA
jgi:hypothetical protein